MGSESLWDGGRSGGLVLGGMSAAIQKGLEAQTGVGGQADERGHISAPGRFSMGARGLLLCQVTAGLSCLRGAMGTGSGGLQGQHMAPRTQGSDPSPRSYSSVGTSVAKCFPGGNRTLSKSVSLTQPLAPRLTSARSTSATISKY